MRTWHSLPLVIVAALPLLGCKTATLPDPNDPADVGTLSPETVRRNLKWANAMLVEREQAGEVTPAQSRDFIARRAAELLKNLDISKVDPNSAWEYGEIFMTAKEWQGARVFLEQAVKVAKTNDRKVNDSLRLAQVYARLGNYRQALDLARTTFSVPAADGAPVLPAVYLEIAPVLAGHGHDAELGQLIVDAVEVHKRVIVDASTDAGKAFLFARRHHVLNALQLAGNLFKSANRLDMAQTVQKQWEKERGSAPLQV